MLLLMNRTLLPPQALFIIRYQKVGSALPGDLLMSLSKVSIALLLPACTRSCIPKTVLPVPQSMHMGLHF